MTGVNTGAEPKVRARSRGGFARLRAAPAAAAWAAAMVAALAAAPAPAQQAEPARPPAPRPQAAPSAEAVAETLRVERLDGRRSALTLDLSAPTGWRVFHLSSPDRLVFDFAGLDWTGAETRIDPEAPVTAARYGLIGQGRSRLVLDLAAPLRIRDAEMADRRGAGRLRVLLERAERDAFDASAGWPEGARPAPPAARAARPRPEGPPVVVIDPGHGGIDPGAIRGETLEKDLVLLFSRDLRDAFARSGRWRPVMTREADVFLSLRDRVAFAEHEGAALFLSIHVNALPRGEARGASIHTLSTDASSEEAEALAEFENRADVLAGMELAGEGDDVVRALVDLARRRTDRRSQRLALTLVERLDGEIEMLERREHSRAGFRVLKSPQVPSALIELGFMSTPSDLEKIEDPAWRARFADALVEAAEAWIAE